MLKHDFDVDQHTTVTIDEQVPEPRSETIDVVRRIWNNDKSIQLMRGYINEIVIDRMWILDPIKHLGEWYQNGKFQINDSIDIAPKFYEIITIHELDGHAFFQWAMINRKKELDEFVKLVDETPPITDYVKINEGRWGKMKSVDGYPYTWLQDEQHSAMAEIDHMLEFGVELLNINLIDTKGRDELLQLYRALHK